MADRDRLLVVGVRHHSPACARRVRQVIEDAQPAWVLVEGPSDFNPHIAELRLPHRLPVAVFSFHAGPDAHHASYAPFCEYSPEWQALQAAWRVGASPLFCDLPSWHPAFGDRANRYADPHGLLARYGAATGALARRLGADGHDALWDALAEQADPADLPAVLDAYFGLLRPDGLHDPAEAAREAHMGAHAAWALRQDSSRPVVLVCGGWHVGGVRAAAAEAAGAAANAGPPPVAEPAPGVRAGSYLVPYAYARLDRFSGYAAGMPSPAYYERVHADGLDAAADWAMARIASALRLAGQVVSTADRIAWHGHAAALARLRGHRAVLRADLLDAALATLVKEALDTPPAWGAHGGGARGALKGDPFVAAALRALAGTGAGLLAPGTRQPPLLQDVAERMRQHGLAPARPAQALRLDWHDPQDRPRAHLLHGLRILGLPGITRDGPDHADARVLTERFGLALHPDWQGALIEAASWGGTLPMAAAARLGARVAEDGGVDAVSACLSEALFAGLLDAAPDLAARLRAGVEACADLAALGRAARRAVRLYRFGDVFGDASHAALAGVCGAAFARALWLLESGGNGAQAVDAVLACRDMALHCPDIPVDRAAAAALFARRVADDAAPPALAGASLGYLVASGGTPPGAAASRIRRFGLPDRLGDFLAGLFALAREELAGTDAMDAVDALVGGWDGASFLRALPALRLAFAWFPPREREALALAILRRRGRGEAAAAAEAMAWMRQPVAVGNQAAAMALEAKVAEQLARHGLA